MLTDEEQKALTDRFEGYLEELRTEPDHMKAMRGPGMAAANAACLSSYAVTALVIVFGEEIAKGFRALAAERLREDPRWHFTMAVPEEHAEDRGALQANRVLLAMVRGQHETAAALSAEFVNHEPDHEQRLEYVVWWVRAAWEIIHDPAFRLTVVAPGEAGPR